MTATDRALLDARLLEIESNPGDQSTWPEVKARLNRLNSLSFDTRVNRSAELLAEAQLWYDAQERGLGVESIPKSRVIDRLAETPFIYQIVHKDIRRAIVHRFLISSGIE